jgi:prepilin-type N-terminal cleavage/methylation domain-containing protein
MKRGFTLIELLVVIAIIGLLSTLSVVSFSTAREKTRVAKANATSAQIARAIGDDAQLLWSFDECSGTALTDRSENKNDGIITLPNWSTDTHDGKGCSLTLNAATSYYTTSKSVSINASSFTTTAWFKTSATTDNYILGDTTTFRQVLSIYNNHVRTCFFNAGCTTTSFTSTMTAINDGQWHFIAFVSDVRSVRIYIDGRSTEEISRTALSNTGSSIVESRFQGNVDELSIYSRAYTAQEIKQKYAEESRMSIAKE